MMMVIRKAFGFSVMIAFGCLLKTPITAQQTGSDWDTNNALGVNAQRYGITKAFMVDNIDAWPSKSDTAVLRVMQIAGSAPANILWPGEKAQITLQIVNKTDQPLKVNGTLRLINYALITAPPGDDLFQVRLVKLGEAGTVPVNVDVPAKGYKDIAVSPPIPAKFGGYAMILELPGQENLYVGSMVRTFKNPPLGDHYRLCMDITNIEALQRLGSTNNRIGFAFRSPGDADYNEYYQRWTKVIDGFKTAGLPIMVEFGHDTPMTGKIQPLGVPRTYLERKDGKLVNRGVYIGDIAWLPQYDKDFKAWVKRIAMEYGWPKGPITAMKLWNEPWEGMSIACWGADSIRFREISVALGEAVMEARKEAGIKILLGGCDSSSNTFDKFFPDGKDTFLPYLDFMSIHYQGLSPATTIKKFVDRKDSQGRPSPVQVWDTESWCANSDDRIAGTLTTMYATGQLRVVGVHTQHVVSPTCSVPVETPAGTQQRSITQAFSVGAAVGALQHFIGNRAFDRILFDGLPFVYSFKGTQGGDGKPDPEDGTVVVVGDVAPVFGANIPLFHTVRCLDDVKAIQPLFQQLSAFPVGSSERAAAEKAWTARATYTGATLTFRTDGVRYSAYDYYGNPVPAQNDQIVIPINDHGYYLRANGQSGSFASLLEALKTARVEGLQPVEIIAHDATAPVNSHPVVTLDLHNMRNEAVTGTLDARMAGLTLSYQKTVMLSPHERRSVALTITDGQAAPGNLYPLAVRFDAGAAGQALLIETMHSNVIARKSIVVDGKLNDWEGVQPQTVSATGPSSRTMEESAWKPFQPYDATTKPGTATAYLAYDKDNFYFAAKVADETPNDGTLRFAARNDDEFFYPEKVYSPDGKEEVWPAGVRRYSYAKDPVLPYGNGADGIQIGFNVLPEKDKSWYPYPPGTLPGFTCIANTDYEYSLHPVAAEYGGGTELWRVRKPGFPDKHFYPHQPKAPGEGAVENGKLIIRWENATRYVECAIPWSEIPDVQKAMIAGLPVKFTYRINDKAPIGVLELAKGRSASRQNNFTLRPDWSEHWENNISFGWAK